MTSMIVSFKVLFHPHRFWPAGAAIITDLSPPAEEWKKQTNAAKKK